ncbi:CD166 antigen homolog A [Daktulosphaira vitifoliae]|uniref:CD166 antigen homolog A n=1 Tax=Daktulosphaira vitifoliae TaxID=58002 RepID=UPI0021AA51FB|nr:CD166 antigen homolog A [Daktulosphaira vitifoliae]XP_050529014.1 CD166 antigen homolog A [Daktulosphaira vitifoliae]
MKSNFALRLYAHVFGTIIKQYIICSIILLFFIDNAKAMAHILRHHQQRDNTGLSTLSPLEQLTWPHSDVKLPCGILPVSNHSSNWLQMKLKWLHNGKNVDLGHRYNLNHNSGILVISNIRVDDNGIWQCVNEKQVARAINLVVLETPKEPYLLIDGRRLDPGNLFVPVKENMDLSIECVVEGGNPMPSLHWLLLPGNSNLDNDENMSSGLLQSNDSYQEQDVSRSSAKIQRVLRAHHNATIACVVTHVTLVNPLNTTILLDVQYTPSFGISRVPGFGIPIREGIPVSLKCDVDSNPPSSPVWQKDDSAPPVLQTDDGYLNFTSIKKNHSGWYKCTSRHLLSEYSSIGYFLNVRYNTEELESVRKELIEEDRVGSVESVEVTVGGEVQLECPSGPSATIPCWAKSTAEDQLEPIGASRNLHIEQVLYQEAGEYKCIVGSKNQNHEKLRIYTVHLNVVGGPIIYIENRTVVAHEGDDTRLSAEFCANPMANKVFWIIADDRVIRPGTTVGQLAAHSITQSTSSYCQVTTLTIKSVLPAHSGEYSLIVGSGKTLVEATVILSVTKSSRNKEPIQTSSSYSVCSNMSNYYLIIKLCLTMSIHMYFKHK